MLDFVRFAAPLRRGARLALAAALASGLGAPAARAVDGVLEISQACVATGCFPGDAAGFPVTTESHQAYALTSSLTVPDVNTTAIQLADGASLDLRGFAIRGPVTCGDFGTAECTASGTGVGVSTGYYTAVRNGAIRGMGSHGISGGGGLEAERLLVESNAGDGIRFGAIGNLSGRGVIRDCRIFQNGGTGILFNFGSPQGSLVEGNVVHANGDDGLRGNGALIRGNRFSNNVGLGIATSFGGEGTGYGDNVFQNNNGGDANPQTSGGVQIGTNMCGGNTTCP